jgi:transglutaminase-like putative cysteine protease
MKYRIIHTTTYDYAAPVTVSHHAARMEPRQSAIQRCEQFALDISPSPSVRKTRSDYFGNRVCFFSVQEIHQHLEITAESIVEVEGVIPPATSLSPPWEKAAALFRDPVSPKVVESYQFCCDSPLLKATPELADFASKDFPKNAPLLAGAFDLCRRIFREFRYDPVATNIATPLEEVLEKRRGVCQDFAHLGIACLRSLGLPARYVSGYLRTRPPEGKPRLAGADASHAWFSVFSPGIGWVDFDPTNNIMPADEHITVAFGRDFSDVSPLSGIITGGGEHDLKVSVDVDEAAPAPSPS